MDNINEWTSLPMTEVLTRVSCRKDWKRISPESSLMSPQRPDRAELELALVLEGLFLREFCVMFVHECLVSYLCPE